jgi:hypothetical protein
MLLWQSAAMEVETEAETEVETEVINIVVMPVFGILKPLFDVSKTFSVHINLRSYSEISDTFVLYNYTQSILLIKCLADNTKIFTYNGKNAEEFLLTIVQNIQYIKLAVF